MRTNLIRTFEFEVPIELLLNDVFFFLPEKIEISQSNRGEFFLLQPYQSPACHYGEPFGGDDVQLSVGEFIFDPNKGDQRIAQSGDNRLFDGFI